MFKKTNAVKRCFTPSKVAVGSVFAIVSVPAFAAVDVAVTTAITEAVTDVGVIGSAVLIVIVTAAAFKWLRRAL